MLLADTGPLVAVANGRDEHHERCQMLLETHRGPVAVPAPVIVEVCQLLASRRGTRAEAAFLTDAESPHRAVVVRFISQAAPFDTVQVVDIDSTTMRAGRRTSVPVVEIRPVLYRRRESGGATVVTQIEADD